MNLLTAHGIDRSEPLVGLLACLLLASMHIISGISGLKQARLRAEAEAVERVGKGDAFD